jgi:peptide/nickel transport system ATP-binding protein
MQRAVELLGQVGIPDPKARVDEYPGQFSGGMLQRAMIAQALAGEPDVLIADEPTTALDVTIQAQILNLLKEIQADRGMSIVLITHDLGVIAEMCDRVCVMYAGEIVERGTLSAVFEETVHPYTQGLLGSMPDVDEPRSRLEPIAGNVPSLLDAEMGSGCYFADRCPKAMESCKEPIGETTVDADADHAARCVLADGEYDPTHALADGHTNHGVPGDDPTPGGEGS